MRSDVIVRASVGSHDVAQMRFTQDDKMIHAFASDRSDQPFGKAILPRYSWIKNQTIAAREPYPPLHLTPQDNQLMSKCSILGLKSALRLAWRGQDSH
jgi:hypothetical protein